LIIDLSETRTVPRRTSLGVATIWRPTIVPECLSASKNDKRFQLTVTQPAQHAIIAFCKWNSNLTSTKHHFKKNSPVSLLNQIN